MELLTPPALVRPGTALKLPVKIEGLSRGEDAKIVVAAVDVGSVAPLAARASDVADGPVAASSTKASTGRPSLWQFACGFSCRVAGAGAASDEHARALREAEERKLTERSKNAIRIYHG